MPSPPVAGAGWPRRLPGGPRWALAGGWYGYGYTRRGMEDLRSRLTLEHEALRGLTQRLSRDLQEGDRAAANATLDTLVQRFRRCVRDREDRLLPHLEEVTGVGALGRSSAMRSEHRVLLDLLAGIERAVSRGDLVVADIDLRELAVTLELHMKKEHSIVDLLLANLPRNTLAADA